MAMQDAFGPVFAYEWLRTSRRWQLYAARAGFIGVILLALATMWMAEAPRGDGMELRRLAAFGRAMYATIVIAELSLLLLAAPAATAGAICLDKARGTLVHVMATDLSDSEIVLGKLAAALIPVVGLVFCMFPVQMLASLLGGADPASLLGTLLVMLGSAFLASTLAFALSAWGRKAHEVLNATYLILFTWVVVLPFARPIAGLFGSSRGGWLDDALVGLAWSTPYMLAEPAYNQSPWDYLGLAALYFGGCLAISALLTLTTVLGLRRAVLTTRVEAEPRRRSWATLRLPSILPSPSLDANPVLWREWSRMRPSRWARATWAAYAALAAGATSLGIFDLTLRSGSGEFAVFSTVFLVGVGLLLLSVRAATSLSEERVRGSLDVLLTTPMTTPEILAGKWWGVFRIVPAIAFLPALIAATVCLETGEWRAWACFVALMHAYGALVTSVGLAVAVWVSRQGRALAISVGLYAVACFGCILVAIVAFGNNDTTAALCAIGSPLYGAAFGILGVMNVHIGLDGMREMIPAVEMIWSAFYFVAAFGLFAAACLTFDRRMGRVPGRSVHGPEPTRLLALLPNFRREPAGSFLEETRP